MDDRSLRCHCNECSQSTSHDVIATRKVEDQEEETGFSWSETYVMLQCRGCGLVCLRSEYEDDTEAHVVSFYPPPVSRRAPAWRTYLPNPMRELLDEIYVALHNNGRRLALMGTRTLVDMLMSEKVGDSGTFAQKLAALQEKGVISDRNASYLKVALDAGHAAAHRGFNPDAHQMNLVMDIVENLLQATYHLDLAAGRLRKKIPARPKASPEEQ